jgi:transcription initiation factor IIE alpha subunit
LEKHGLDDEEIVKVPQVKSGKSRQYLYLLLVIIAIIASKSVASDFTA